LSQYAPETTQASFLLTDSEYVFYDFASMKTSMSFYRSKPTMFDVILFVVIATYLAGLYAALVGPAEVVKQVQRLFDNKSKKVSSTKKKA
jgi:hypothetical protein